MPRVRRWAKGRFLRPRSEDADAVRAGSTNAMIGARKLSREAQHLRNLVLTNAPLDRHLLKESLDMMESYLHEAKQGIAIIYEGLGRSELVPHTQVTTKTDDNE